MYLEKQPLNSEEAQKVSNSIHLINHLQEAGKLFGNRIVISGGYATDGALGEITRPHSDIDIQIYGRNGNAEEAVRNLFIHLSEDNLFYADLVLQDKGRKDFYHNFLIEKGWLGADIYYLHVDNDPFDENKVIVKSDGTLSEPHPYSRLTGTLEGVRFGIQEPLTEIVDKIYKREFRGDEKKEKHEQDIHNLETITDKNEVKQKLDELTTV